MATLYGGIERNNIPRVKQNDERGTKLTDFPNQSVRSTKMGPAYQKWPNLKYETYVNPVFVHFAPLHSHLPLSPFLVTS
jgi:hypothetical protein